MARDFSSTSFQVEERCCVENSLKVEMSERDEPSYSEVKENSSTCPDISIKDRVYKEVGSTSIAFIGPACRPPTDTATPNVEETLNEFYKELKKIEKEESIDKETKQLEKVDSTDGISPKDGLTTTHLDNFVNQKSTGKKRTSHRRCYQSETHENPKRPTDFSLNLDGAAYSQPHGHWQHHPPFQSKPYAAFHPTPHFDHSLPFPPVFHGQADIGPQSSQYWNCSNTSNHYEEDLAFPPEDRFSPPNKLSRRFKDFDRNPVYHSDRDDVEYDGDDDHSGNGNIRWSDNGSDGWCQNSDRHQRSYTEMEPHTGQKNRPPEETRTSCPSLVLILMRGAPGSGKSTMARQLLSTRPSGLILSTDDYFREEDGYFYDPRLLGIAHQWNQNRAKKAMDEGRSPIIIDNTNIQAWEMKPYVKYALDRGYNIGFQEPDTSWKFDPPELEKRNKHGVPQDKIAQMLDRFSHPISVDVVMSSQEPPHVSTRRHPQQHHQRKIKNSH